MEDIEEAVVFILFTEEPGNGGRRGGRHTEMGFAMGSGLTCAIVGPRENTFHCLSEVEVFPTLKECIDWLDELRSDDIRNEIENDA